MPPLVSVTIRTHNRLAYLRQAVESVLQQSFTDWELILSDDASSDDTPAYCQELQRADSRVRVFRNVPGLGASRNWCFCLQQSRGRYFVALDDDNRFLPTFLATCVAAMQSQPDAAYAFTDEWRIDGNGSRNAAETEADSKIYGRLGLAAGLHRDTVGLALQQSVGINGALLHREKLIGAGGFRELAGDFADFDLFLNLAAQGHAGVYIAARLVEYRRHGAQDGDTYALSVPKSRSSIASLESVHFTGEQEGMRRRKLAVAYSALGRVLMIHSQLLEARGALHTAWKLDRFRRKTLAALILTCLPAFVIKRLMQKRYGRHR